MKVLCVNSAQYSVYAKRNLRTCDPRTEDCSKVSLKYERVAPVFKGDTGAAIGVFSGAAIGALTAAIIVATGGLAAPVAAVGLGGVMATGAGAGTHLGGIIGHFIEENLDK